VRAVRAALWGVCAFVVTDLLSCAYRWPTIAYDPVARVATLTTEVHGVWMRYYGDLAWTCASGLCAAALELVSQRPPRAVGTLTGATLSLVVLDVGFHLSRFFATV